MSIPTPMNMHLPPPDTILPPGFLLDKAIRNVMDNGPPDLMISRKSCWRFTHPTGVGQYVTKYPYDESLALDLLDDQAVGKTPFGPNYLSVTEAAMLLCLQHNAPTSDMSSERAQAFSRLRTLKVDPENHIFWSDLAIRVSVATCAVRNCDLANLGTPRRFSTTLT